jgi:hypothetical protein
MNHWLNSLRVRRPLDLHQMLARRGSPRLLSPFHLRKNPLQNLQTGHGRVGHNTVFCPVMEVMRKCFYLGMVWSVVPPLDQSPARVLPVVTVRRYLQRALRFQDALGHLDQPAVRKGDAIPVVQGSF